MRNVLFILLIFSLICVAGCGQEPGQSQTANGQSQFSKIYTEEELGKLITPGMSISDITNRFGPPGSTVNWDEHTVLLTYMFPLDWKHIEEGRHLTGFGVDVKDDRVLRWSPVTGGVGKPLDGGPQNSFGEQSFKVFTATGDLTNTVNSFDENGSTDANSLKVSPNLTFTAQMYVGKSQAKGFEEQTVRLVLSDHDASGLRTFSEGNIGKRILIVYRGRVLAAPLISEPLPGKQVTFTIRNMHDLDAAGEQ